MSRSAWTGWLWGLAALGAALVLTQPLPVTDLPQHAATIATVRDLLFGLGEASRSFALSLSTTQYVAFYLLGAVLAVPLGAEGAAQALLAVAAFAWPFAVRSLARALGADERLALLSVPLFWSQSFLVGFLNYLTALPLLVWLLAVLVRHVEAPSRRSGLTLAAGTVGLFLLHLSAFVFFVPAAVWVTWVFHPQLASVRRLTWLTPALALAMLWALRSPVTQPHAAGFVVPTGVTFHTPLESLRALPEALTDIWQGSLDSLLLVGWLGVVVVLIVRTPRRAKAQWALVGLVTLATLLYFAMPYSVGWLFVLNERNAVIAALLLPLVAAPSVGRATSMAFVFAGLVATASVVLAGERLHAFRKESQGLEAMLRQLPPGARVLSLAPEADSTSAVAKFLPYHHVVALHRARTGGVVEPSFVTLPQSPVRYLAGAAPPPKPYDWEWTREGVPTAEDLLFFDAVVVRGARPPSVPAAWTVQPVASWWVACRPDAGCQGTELGGD